MGDKTKRLLLVVNVDWFLILHRLSIAEAAKERGWEVYVAAYDSGSAEKIRSKGINFINISFSRSGTNVIQELKTVYNFYKLYKRVQPDVVHHITLKPVIYGSVVSRLTKIRGTLNAISGLGYTFTSERKGIVQKFMITLLKYGFKQNNLQVIFQNKDDFNEVKSLGALDPRNQINFIKGSGVNLDDFIIGGIKCSTFFSNINKLFVSNLDKK